MYTNDSIFPPKLAILSIVFYVHNFLYWNIRNLYFRNYIRNLYFTMDLSTSYWVSVLRAVSECFKLSEDRKFELQWLL